MTSHELAVQFGNEFGFKNWPKTFEVDADTYGHVCQTVLDQALKVQFPYVQDEFMLAVAVGPNNGLMFKNVELILRRGI